MSIDPSTLSPNPSSPAKKTLDEAMLADYTITVTGATDADNSTIAQLMNQLSIEEFTLTESLLSPTLTCSIKVQNYRHVGYVKNLDKFAYANINVKITRDILSYFGTMSSFEANLRINSITNRIPLTYQVDTFAINGCDNTLLINVDKLLSKSWQCTQPSQMVSDILNNCIEAPRIQIEDAQPQRTYIAENIHPFQAISEIADFALASNNDPSFLHFMTFEDSGVHKFQSLQNMVKQPLSYSFYYQEIQSDPNMPSYANPNTIMSYEFPCDYDILLDLLNAVDLQGNDQNSLIVINPFNGIQSLLGSQRQGCGVGGPTINTQFTDKQSSTNCETDVEVYRLKRQARLNLLEPDKLPLRITVPWNPVLHCGNMINITIPNKQNDSYVPDYGSGKYLIASMSHIIKKGGFAVTVLDCVSESVGYSGSTIGK